MLQSRLRPVPRRNPPPSNGTSIPDSAETSDFDDNDDPEGLFGCFLPHLFPDDAPSFHGDPGQTLLYSSPLQQNELEIMVPRYPGEDSGGGSGEEKGKRTGDTDDERKLFAHLLWSAALLVAEGLGRAATGLGGSGHVLEKEEMRWSVKGENVLELGAGTALPSIISLLANAASVTATDHSSSPALGPNGAICKNIEKNLPETLRSRASVHPHEWGDLDSSFARENRASFTRIIAADCLWIKGQHENLVKTMLWFLSDGKESSGGSNGKIWVVAGFHTGRAIVASFFDTAVKMGLDIEEIWERDINAGYVEDGDTLKAERGWSAFRKGESVDHTRRWCVVAILRRRKGV